MGRLAMRPWPVFIAQLLQFQDQLGSAWPDPGGPATPGTPVGTSVRSDVSNQLTEALRLMQTRKLREPTDLLESALAVLRGDKPAVSVTSLVDLGFEDLPPAGYLPAQWGGLPERIWRLFPVQTGIVVNEYRADPIVELVARAQHADRIPLTRDGGASGRPGSRSWCLSPSRTRAETTCRPRAPGSPSGAPSASPPTPRIPRAEDPRSGPRCGYALPWVAGAVIVTSSDPEWTVSSKPLLLPMPVPPPPCGTVAPPKSR